MQADGGCRGLLHSGWRGLICAILLGVMPVPVSAAMAAVAVESVRASHDEAVNYLDLRLNYQLSDVMRDAVQDGMALTFLVEIELLRERSYVWDSTVAVLEQRYRLSYQTLTRNYLVQNLNSGAQYILPTLELALSVLGTVSRVPVIDRNLLDNDEQYYGRVRAGLDIAKLPIPLRLQSYLALAPGWQMSSDWVAWKLP